MRKKKAKHCCSVRVKYYCLPRAGVSMATYLLHAELVEGLTFIAPGRLAKREVERTTTAVGSLLCSVLIRAPDETDKDYKLSECCVCVWVCAVFTFKVVPVSATF